MAKKNLVATVTVTEDPNRVEVVIGDRRHSGAWSTDDDGDGDRFHGAVDRSCGAARSQVYADVLCRHDVAWGYVRRYSLYDGSVVGWTAGGTHLRPREHWLAPGVAP